MRLGLALNFCPLQGWDSSWELHPTILDLHCELRQGASGSHSPGEESGGNCGLRGRLCLHSLLCGSLGCQGIAGLSPVEPTLRGPEPHHPGPGLLSPSCTLQTSSAVPQHWSSTASCPTLLSRPDTDINANTWGFIGLECFRGGPRHHTPLMIGRAGTF